MAILYFVAVTIVCLAALVLKSPKQMRKLAAWLDTRAHVEEQRPRIFAERYEIELRRRELLPSD